MTTLLSFKHSKARRRPEVAELICQQLVRSSVHRVVRKSISAAAVAGRQEQKKERREGGREGAK